MLTMHGCVLPLQQQHGMLLLLLLLPAVQVPTQG
jgi:hypothetical protein